MWGGARHHSFLTIARVSLAGCGGGSGGGGGAGDQPSPPTPDFTIGSSTSSLTLSQGDASSPGSISVTPQHGCTADVSVALSGIPAGISTNPGSPFAVASDQSVAVVLGAATDASG
jgi:hypothetical protein